MGSDNQALREAMEKRNGFSVRSDEEIVSALDSLILYSGFPSNGVMPLEVMGENGAILYEIENPLTVNSEGELIHNKNFLDLKSLAAQRTFQEYAPQNEFGGEENLFFEDQPFEGPAETECEFYEETSAGSEMGNYIEETVEWEGTGIGSGEGLGEESTISTAEKE